MPTRWSDRLSAKFGLSLTPDLLDWLDGNVRERVKLDHAGLFDIPGNPERLMDPSSGQVWGGQMLPDTLPLLGSASGDQLAVRIGADGSVSEVIRWDHECGTWRPFGATLPEAILCDVAIWQNEGESVEEESDTDNQALEHWAAHWVRHTTGPALDWPVPLTDRQPDGLVRLHQAGICEIVVLTERCVARYRAPLAERAFKYGCERLAERLGVPWEDVSKWLFDTAAVPPRQRTRLGRILQTSPEELLHQNWDQARALAARVSELRPDLAWPYAIMGWSAQRVGKLDEAIATYYKGLRSLGTTYDYEALINEGFLHERLAELHDELPKEISSDDYLQAACNRPTWPNNQDPLHRYWMKLARTAEAHGDYHLAYDYYYRAGWDRRIVDDMDEILDGLIRTSSAAGYEARHRIARHHLDTLS